MACYIALASTQKSRPKSKTSLVSLGANAVRWLWFSISAQSWSARGVAFKIDIHMAHAACQACQSKDRERERVQGNGGTVSVAVAATNSTPNHRQSQSWPAWQSAEREKQRETEAKTEEIEKATKTANPTCALSSLPPPPSRFTPRLPFVQHQVACAAF